MLARNAKLADRLFGVRTGVRDAGGILRSVIVQFCVLALLVFALSLRSAPNTLAETTAGLASLPPGPVIATENGLVTALFSEQTDDAALAAGLPALISKGVQAVNLHGAPIHDLRPLGRLKDLQDLNLAGTQVRDITAIAGFVSLRNLNLQFLRIDDLSPLARLVALRTLNIAGTEVHDLSPISHLTGLREIAAAVTQLRDLTPLAGLRQLASVDLGSTWVSNIAPLTEARMLRFLNLNGTQVQDLQPVANMVCSRRSTSEGPGSTTSDRWRACGPYRF